MSFAATLGSNPPNSRSFVDDSADLFFIYSTSLCISSQFFCHCCCSFIMRTATELFMTVDAERNHDNQLMGLCWFWYANSSSGLLTFSYQSRFIREVNHSKNLVLLAWKEFLEFLRNLQNLIESDKSLRNLNRICWITWKSQRESF